MVRGDRMAQVGEVEGSGRGQHRERDATEVLLPNLFYTFAQDVVPEKLYEKDSLSRQFDLDKPDLQNDYPNSQELELEAQPGEVWRRI